MKILRVLFLENTKNNSFSLKQNLSRLDSIKLIITNTFFQESESVIKDSIDKVDIVLFAENIPSKHVITLTKLIRSLNTVVPIFLLTKESDARIAKKYRIAGVDDTYNIAEFNTPLFAWTFLSAIEETRLKRKAKEYDQLHDRLSQAHQDLSVLIHDIINPLSVIRLALYHIDNPNLAVERKEVFLKLLVENIERLDKHIKELRAIRHRMNGKNLNVTKTLSFSQSNSADGVSLFG